MRTLEKRGRLIVGIEERSDFTLECHIAAAGVTKKTCRARWRAGPARIAAVRRHRFQESSIAAPLASLHDGARPSPFASRA
jgi:hypothetical protein